MRSYLVDLYPEEKARIRIIIDGFDCGVYEKIKNADIVDKLLINGLYNTLEKDYGYTHTLSEWCVNEWLQVLGKSRAAEDTVSPTTNKKAVSLTATTKTSKSNNAVQKQDDKFERNTSVFVNKEQQILQGELADLQNQEIAKLRGEFEKK